MLIKNTDAEAVCPWPEGTFIQGGKRGLVIRREGGGTYTTAFVEAFPGGTFLRGEGETITDAEKNAWAKYERWRDCDGTGQPHGPWEARHYENGSGFCTRCGAWGSKVLEPSENYKAGELAYGVAKRYYGEDISVSPWWREVHAYFKAVLIASWNQRPYPPEPEGLPSKEQYDAWRDEQPAEPAEEEVRAEIAAILVGLTKKTEEDGA